MLGKIRRELCVGNIRSARLESGELIRLWLEAQVQQWLQRGIEASRSESHGVGATLGAPGDFELKIISSYQYLEEQFDSPRPTKFLPLDFSIFLP